MSIRTLTLLFLLCALAACSGERSQISGGPSGGIEDSGQGVAWPPLVPSAQGTRVLDEASRAAFVAAASEVTCLVLRRSDTGGMVRGGPELRSMAGELISRHGLSPETYEIIQRALLASDHAPTRALIYAGAQRLCGELLTPSGVPREVPVGLPSSAGGLDEGASRYVEAAASLGCAALSAEGGARDVLLRAQGFDEASYISEGWRLRDRPEVFEQIVRRLHQCGPYP